MNKIGRYFLNLAILLDEAVNTLAGGDPGETISSRAYKAQQANKRWGCVLCKALAWITRGNHCQKAYEAYTGSRAVIPDGE